MTDHEDPVAGDELAEVGPRVNVDELAVRRLARHDVADGGWADDDALPRGQYGPTADYGDD